MKITILGTGAMACLFAARLSELADITLLGTWREAIDAIRREGIRLETPAGTKHASVRAGEDPGQCADSDLVLVLVKSYQTQAAAERARSILKADGLALTLQNGLGNVEILRDVFGAARASVGAAILGATLLAPGAVRLQGEGPLWLENHARISPAAGILHTAGFETHLTDAPDSMLWGKLVVNSAINPLTALLRVPNGEIAEREQVRLTAQMVARETAAIAGALGIALPYDDPAAQVLDVARRTAGNRSSMLQDLENGRPTEIDAINGAAARAAEERDLPAPWNHMLWQMVKVAENLPPSGPG